MMRPLSDPTLDHLRRVADWPDLSGTKYEVARKIASGGMGTVYLARDRDLERQVALKVLNTHGISTQAVSRMLREARILARLEHPSVVPIHDVGRLPDGRVYYAMKLIRGERLDRCIHPERSLAELLRIFQRICEAVGFAHAHSVIHRDLKPQNIMVGSFGEVLVLDWGVAKFLSEAVTGASGDEDSSRSIATSETAAGTVIGTPGYMAPEQARGQNDEVDKRADVYALGGILYFLLTGSPPLEAGAGLETETGVRREALKRTTAPPALAAITMKALAAEPNQRYSSVEELAGEVAAFLGGLSVAAYPESLFKRTRRLARKYRTPLLLVLTYLLMRILLFVWSRT